MNRQLSKPYWVFKTQDACHAPYCRICTNQWRWWCRVCEKGASVASFQDAFKFLKSHHNAKHSPPTVNVTVHRAWPVQPFQPGPGNVVNNDDGNGRLLQLLNQWHNGPGEAKI